MGMSKKTTERIQSQLKRYQAIIQAQRDRDVSEADTVTLVKDVLSDVFGFDKYAELTSEHSVRGTYCDLAVSISGRLQLLIEVKAIGLELKDSHIKQAVDYASNQGCEWVVLTNGIRWVVYHVIFKKPIDKQEVACVDLLQVNPKNNGDLEKLFLFTREGVTESAAADFRDRQDATSRFVLAAMLLKSEALQSTMRREIRRISGIVVDQESIEKTLREHVIKREAIEGDAFDSACRRVARTADKAIVKKDSCTDDVTPAIIPPATSKSAPPAIPN